MKRIFIPATLFILLTHSLGLYGKSFPWRSGELPGASCDITATNYSFDHSGGYSEDNAFLYMWAIHTLENGGLDALRDSFGQIGFKKLRFINEDASGAQVVIART